MKCETWRRKPGSPRLPESVCESFLAVLGSGLSPTAAASVAGVSHTTGLRWAKAAGYQTDSKHHGVRYRPTVRAAFWEAMHSGSSVAKAAVIAGVSEPAAMRWVQQAGYVRENPCPR
jgi:transposase-like protein